MSWVLGDGDEDEDNFGDAGLLGSFQAKPR